MGKTVFQAGAHGVTGGTMSAIEGSSFISGFAAGAVSSLIGSGTQGLGIKGKDLKNVITIASGGLSGGISSTIAGGNFWAGARQGLITSGLNHAAHGVAKAMQKKAIVGFYGAGHITPGVEGYENESFEDLVKSKGGRMFGHGNRQVRKAVKYLEKASKNGKRIEIYGYSRGGSAAVQAANMLGEVNVQVHKLVLFDPHILWDNTHLVLTGANVREVHNFYQRNPRTGGQFGFWGSNPYWGRPVYSEYGTQFNPGVGINNYNLTGHNFRPNRPVSHNNIVRHVSENYKL